ncbi:hypothetical protein ACHAXT_013147 [Thalassiosira profunda]
MASDDVSCTLAFHGAAANSCPHSILWVRAPGGPGDESADDGASPSPSSDGLVDTVLYASSGVVSLATSHACLSNNVTSVDRTLVTRTRDRAGEEGAAKRVLARGEAAEDAAAARSVTALAWVDGGTTNGKPGGAFGIAAAFSDGTLTSWRRKDDGWREHVLMGHDPGGDTSCAHYREGADASNLQESIADVSACNIDERVGSTWMVATASSKGIFLHLSHVSEVGESVHTKQVGHHAAASVLLQPRTKGEGMGECYLFAGSASPRHNKVFVYTVPYFGDGEGCAMDTSSPPWASLPKLTVEEPHYHGHLLGHQDWVTCFGWLDHFASSVISDERRESLLASSGHDAKIRLWKFSSRASSAKDCDDPELEDERSISDDDSGDDEANIDDLDEEEGEARLVIRHTSSSTTTAVSLEALLMGHEEAVTSLNWRTPTKGSEERPCLLSSSMDRTILLWMEEEDAGAGAGGGVWVPISRVGSAGGILGGSIGASFMGFVDAAFSPDAKRIVGHGYGGSIHFWTQAQAGLDPTTQVETDDAMAEGDDAMATARWIADPCITGHFRSVEDMAWDPDGQYLLTTSTDQTTRLWTDVPTSTNIRRWVEVGRPQVHGYDMTSIVCIGSCVDGSQSENGEPSHRFASGADEKVLRVFDAPASALRTLRAIKQSRQPESGEDQTSSWRVERAFMPSLGLSNKATADTEQESSTYSGPVNDDEFVESLDTVKREAVELKLPSERDLGVTTLWPETRKLFGHESELVCLDAYRAPLGEPTLVASSCKARNDVASAAIRLWDANKGKCVGVLKGGHRSTVSTMSFSCDGQYLASSGKDRRICIWKRLYEAVDGRDDGPPYELCAAVDSAHKRIVWAVHFCPRRPDILASGSRDSFVKIWRILDAPDGSLEMKELFALSPSAGKIPVTAVAFAEETLSKEGGAEHGILSIGTESGRVEFWAIPLPAHANSSDVDSSTGPALLHAVLSDNCHFDAVKKVSWRPTGTANTDGTRELTLASCGADSSVRIFNLKCDK